MGQHTCSPRCQAQLKPKKKAKPKVRPLPALVREADTLASLLVRQKFADKDGMVKCCTCETVLHWKESHCAHFVERIVVQTRWMEENLHPACPSCNVFRKERHKRIYTLYMIDMHGRAFVDELERYKGPVSPSMRRQLAEEAIAYYSEKLKELKA